MERGEVRPALAAARARRATHRRRPASRTSTAREVLFRLGVCRYKLSSISTAVGALQRGAEAGGALASFRATCSARDILGWRSRCYRRQRDFEAAREDVERALELAQALDDHRTMANVYFQASLVAERMGHWVLARSYAERAKAYYEELNDERNVGRLLNNLGGLNFQLGKPERGGRGPEERVPRRCWTRAATPRRRTSSRRSRTCTWRPVRSRRPRRRRGTRSSSSRAATISCSTSAPTQLVLGRALMEQGRLDEAEEMLRTAEASAEQLESISHRAAAWMAQGDLAARRGEDRDGRTAVPEGRRGPSGRPLLNRGRR